ncbi:cupin domain-containing protein [Micromonospora taraxaci]|uniref:cupin domain-containing protein n=1 Tax=Micromonospora taraxaci TaxID=1316803 RepID=UPI0033DEA3A1
MTVRPPLAEQFDLQPHPEGGWFRETYRSAVTFEPDGYPGRRAAATAILFLLEPGDSSAWHTVRSDEIWFWHSGGPLALTVGRGSRPMILSVECPQILVPAGEWQSAKPAGDRHVLVSCVVSPGFDFADFTMP